MKKIVYFNLEEDEEGEGGDWSGLYIDGKLVYENHSIDLYSLLREYALDEKIGCEIFTLDISMKEFEKYGLQCPKELPEEWEKRAE